LAASPGTQPITPTAELPNTEPPRSLYNEAGDRKSPELRGAEIKGANIAAKGLRFAQALRSEACPLKILVRSTQAG